jgi:hypothetical protein
MNLKFFDFPLFDDSDLDASDLDASDLDNWVMDYSVLYNSVYNNPAKERVDCEDGWLIKSSFITKDEMKACQLTKIKLPPKK